MNSQLQSLTGHFLQIAVYHAQTELLCDLQCAVAQTVSDHFHITLLQRFCQRHAICIVKIQHHKVQLLPIKQFALGRRITLHIAVIIEVVAAQIGEHRDVETHRIHPSLGQRMR